MLYSGKIECALFGGYVDNLQKLMGKAVEGMPVVVVQFAKIKIFLVFWDSLSLIFDILSLVLHLI